ncbi:MAG TPA: GGDEF domain-containing protein [Gammaproteobacteria bacterium]
MSLYPLRRLIVPSLLLISAFLLKAELPDMKPAYHALLDRLPYLTLGLAMVLCIFYNRARLFSLALTLLLAYWLIDTQLQSRLAEPRPLFIYSMLAMALPLTVFLLLVFPERGLRNRYGFALILLAPVQLLGAWMLWNYFPDAVLAVKNTLKVLPFGGRYYLPHIVAACFMVCSAAGFYMLCRYDSEHAAALLGTLLFVFVTLAFFKEARISAVMFGVAGLNLIISLVRSSYDMAYYDDLTGLRGRRALNERLRGLAGNYTVAMLDVDHFKQFNDNYGHEAGDEVLKMVATHINQVRGGGRAYRYGGEEFCIIFDGKTMDACLPHLEAVRATVEAYALSLRDRKTRPRSRTTGQQQRGTRSKPEMVSVTVSIGAATCADHEDPQEVIQAADAALYKAKKKGRNRVVY